MPLSAQRVWALRDYIAKNRCAIRPGLTHKWTVEYIEDSWDMDEVVICLKCGYKVNNGPL